MVAALGERHGESTRSDGRRSICYRARPTAPPGHQLAALIGVKLPMLAEYHYRNVIGQFDRRLEGSYWRY